MNMNLKQPDLRSLLNRTGQDVEKARRFSVVGFVVLVALVYGFLFLKINSLENIEPSSDSVTSQVQSAQVPRIDQKVVRQLESLHDNSVNVRTLFNQTRSNPFSN